MDQVKTWIFILNLYGLLSFTGTLEIHILGCQSLLENIPGRSRAPTTHGSPDTKNFIRYKTGGSSYGRGGSGRGLRTDELCGMKSNGCFFIFLQLCKQLFKAANVFLK